HRGDIRGPREEADRQDRAGAVNADGAGHQARDVEARPAGLEGAHPVPGVGRAAAGPRLRSRPDGEGVRDPRHAHGAAGEQAEGDHAVLHDGGPLRARLPEADVRGHRVRRGAGHRVDAIADYVAVPGADSLTTAAVSSYARSINPLFVCGVRLITPVLERNLVEPFRDFRSSAEIR